MHTTIEWFKTALDEIVAFLPNLIAGLVLLLAGYIVARVLARATRSIARRIGFERFVARLGIRELSAQSGKRAPSHLLGSAVYLVVLVATMMQTARVWDLTFVASGLARVIAYVPHVVGASVVFALALFLGNWVRDRLSVPRTRADGTVETTYAGIRILPSAVRVGILAIGSFMALRELQIAPEIVNAAFIVTISAIAVASALAFGLGARDVAGRIAQSWYDRRSGRHA